MEYDASLELPLIGTEVVLLKVLQEGSEGRLNDSSLRRKEIADPRLGWYRGTDHCVSLLIVEFSISGDVQTISLIWKRVQAIQAIRIVLFTLRLNVEGLKSSPGLNFLDAKADPPFSR